MKTVTKSFSCSVNYNGKNYILGGQYEKRQISEVHHNQVKRTGKLPFDFSFGSCTVLLGQIFMCFDDTHAKKCRLTTNLKNFIDVPNSEYHHRGIRIASNSLDRTGFSRGSF